MNRITRKNLDYDYHNAPCHDNHSDDSGNEEEGSCGEHSLVEEKNRDFDQRYAGGIDDRTCKNHL